MQLYFSGEKIYGDDLSFPEVLEWFKDEEEGYSSLGAKDRDAYEYSYHAMNYLHGYRYLKNRRFKHALGVGSAYGDELIPISKQLDRITIIDPSSYFRVNEINKLVPE